MENRRAEAVVMLNRGDFAAFFIVPFVVLLLFDLLRICKNHSGLLQTNHDYSRTRRGALGLYWVFLAQN